MGNPSTIEVHPEKEAIEVAIQKGVPYRTVSANFGISVGAIQRWKKRTLKAKALAADIEVQEAAEAAKSATMQHLEGIPRILARWRDIEERLDRAVARAERSGNMSGLIAALRESRALIADQIMTMTRIEELKSEREPLVIEYRLVGGLDGDN